MQDVDRPAHVQRSARAGQAPPHRAALAGPSRDRRGLRWRRDFGQKPAVRSAEPQLAVGLSIDLVALLVNGAVVPATEQGEIRNGGGAPLGPVTDVMALPEPHPAAREAAVAVSVMERPPDRRWDRASPSSGLHHTAVETVLHHHPARIARQAAETFPRERGRRPRGQTGRARRDPRGPGHRRGRQPRSEERRVGKECRL